jgi:hypothetical protein
LPYQTPHNKDFVLRSIRDSDDLRLCDDRIFECLPPIHVTGENSKLRAGKSAHRFRGMRLRDGHILKTADFPNFPAIQRFDQKRSNAAQYPIGGEKIQNNRLTSRKTSHKLFVTALFVNDS